ncbi:hypothetical protein Sango_3034800 [Sesamum angolense]|uniref:Uncharacterized protein n=1 Tax=Sesamum angolense TaxID=2727404 RepID=A0AAE1TB74_9LAMI|nr:hypothetical protein Sango_3034800 [Sesamum angolense]
MQFTCDLPENWEAVLSEDKIQAHSPSAGVQLLEQDNHIVMHNGIVSITLTVPGGAVTNITYKESGNLLETKDAKDHNRGHWDVVWSKLPEGGNMVDNLEGTSYTIIVQNENQTEISFTRTLNVGSSDAPLNVDKGRQNLELAFKDDFVAVPPKAVNRACQSEMPRFVLHRGASLPFLEPLYCTEKG